MPPSSLVPSIAISFGCGLFVATHLLRLRDRERLRNGAYKPVFLLYPASVVMPCPACECVNVCSLICRLRPRCRPCRCMHGHSMQPHSETLGEEEPTHRLRHRPRALHLPGARYQVQAKSRRTRGRLVRDRDGLRRRAGESDLAWLALLYLH
jgi:hypothetical protein